MLETVVDSAPNTFTNTVHAKNLPLRMLALPVNLTARLRGIARRSSNIDTRIQHKIMIHRCASDAVTERPDRPRIRSKLGLGGKPSAVLDVRANHTQSIHK